MLCSPVSFTNRYDALRLAVSYSAARRGELVLHDRAGGLFSLYCQVLGCLLVSDLLGCSLRLHFLEGDYRTSATGSEGWWIQFFETSVYNPERNRGKASVELPPTKKSARFAHLGVGMDRHLAHSLSTRLPVRPGIESSVSFFEKEHLRGHPVIGIHYRGTDKLLIEAVRVPYEAVIETLTRMDSRIRFFIATDEHAFLEAMKENFGERVVYLDHHRSIDGTPVHHFDSGHESLGYTRGLEAILDAMILARCNGMIRTSSNLSLASTFLNPNIPVLLFDPAKRPWKTAAIQNFEQAILNPQ